MNTFVIYDSEGKVVFKQDGVEDTSVTFTPMFLEVPEGKILVGIDTETKQPIFEDKPKDAVTLLNELKLKLEQQEEMSSDLETALYDMAEVLSLLAEGGGK